MDSKTMTLEYLERIPEKIKKLYTSQGLEIISEIIYNIYLLRKLVDGQVLKKVNVPGTNDTVDIDNIRTDIMMEKLPLPPINKVYLKDSPIHGKGVFASKNIQKGEVVTFYGVDIVLLKLGERMIPQYSSRFLETYDEKAREEFSGKEGVMLQVDDCCFNVSHFSDDNDYLGHMINDSFTGNVRKMSQGEYNKDYLKRINCCIEPTRYKLKSIVIATRDIKKDEELVTHYGFSHWKAGLYNKNKKKKNKK